MAADLIEPYAATIIRVRSLLKSAEEAQWQSGRTITAADDTTERSKGMVGDPTFSTAADTRRLELRAAVVEAEIALEKAGKTLQAAERHLSDAIEKWHG